MCTLFPGLILSPKFRFIFYNTFHYHIFEQSIYNLVIISWISGAAHAPGLTQHTTHRYYTRPVESCAYTYNIMWYNYFQKSFSARWINIIYDRRPPHAAAGVPNGIDYYLLYRLLLILLLFCNSFCFLCRRSFSSYSSLVPSYEKKKR